MRGSPLAALSEAIGLAAQTPPSAPPAGREQERVPTVPNRLSAMGEMTLAISRVDSVEAICREAMAGMARTLGSSRAAILLYDQDDVPRFRSWHRLSEEYRRALDGQVPGDMGAAGPEPLLVPDLEADRTLGAWREASLAEGARALAVLPLIAAGGATGLFALYFDATRTLEPDELHLARTIASHTAYALDRQRAVSRLEAERALFVHGPVVVLEWREPGGRGVTSVSPNFEAQFGWRPSLLLRGEADFDGLVHPEDRQAVGRERRRLEEGLASIELEYRLRRPDGEYRWVYEYTVVTSDGAGQVWCRGCLMDITARRKAESALRAAEARLREAQRLESLGVLAGGVAHDFNNLLLGIMGNAGLALGDLPVSSPTHATIREIELAARRAADLTRQLLAYSGKGKFLVEPLNLSTLVEESLETALPLLAAGVRLTCDLAPALPEIEGDADQIRQVIMNLLSNASEALPAGNGDIAVRTSRMEVDEATLSRSPLLPGTPAGSYVVLEVRDGGVGMDGATVRRIFDPFFSTKFQGRGLGLSAALGIVHGHRGAILVDSTPGQGSIFRVLFPVHAPAEGQPAAGDGRPLSAAGGQEGGGSLNRAILVVDDEEMVRNVTRRTLERIGYRVLMAENGRVALDLLATAHAEVGLVILDLTMPELGGEETFALIRERWPGLKVILSSGYSAEGGAGRLTEQGLAGFIQKPYLPSELVETVQRVFG